MPRCLLNAVRRRRTSSNGCSDESAPANGVSRLDGSDSSDSNVGIARHTRSKQRKAVKRKRSLNNLSVVTRFYMHEDNCKRGKPFENLPESQLNMTPDVDQSPRELCHHSAQTVLDSGTERPVQKRRKGSHKAARPIHPTSTRADDYGRCSSKKTSKKCWDAWNDLECDFGYIASPADSTLPLHDQEEPGFEFCYESALDGIAGHQDPSALCNPVLAPITPDNCDYPIDPPAHFDTHMTQPVPLAIPATSDGNRFAGFAGGSNSFLLQPKKLCGRSPQGQSGSGEKYPVQPSEMALPYVLASGILVGNNVVPVALMQPVWLQTATPKYLLSDKPSKVGTGGALASQNVATSSSRQELALGENYVRGQNSSARPTHISTAPPTNEELFSPKSLATICAFTATSTSTMPSKSKLSSPESLSKDVSVTVPTTKEQRKVSVGTSSDSENVNADFATVGSDIALLHEDSETHLIPNFPRSIVEHDRDAPNLRMLIRSDASKEHLKPRDHAVLEKQTQTQANREGPLYSEKRKTQTYHLVTETPHCLNKILTSYYGDKKDTQKHSDILEPNSSPGKEICALQSAALDLSNLSSKHSEKSLSYEDRLSQLSSKKHDAISEIIVNTGSGEVRFHSDAFSAKCHSAEAVADKSQQIDLGSIYDGKEENTPRSKHTVKAKAPGLLDSHTSPLRKKKHPQETTQSKDSRVNKCTGISSKHVQELTASINVNQTATRVNNNVTQLQDVGIGEHAWDFTTDQLNDKSFSSEQQGTMIHQYDRSLTDNIVKAELKPTDAATQSGDALCRQRDSSEVYFAERNVNTSAVEDDETTALGVDASKQRPHCYRMSICKDEENLLDDETAPGEAKSSSNLNQLCHNVEDSVGNPITHNENTSGVEHGNDSALNMAVKGSDALLGEQNGPRKIKMFCYLPGIGGSDRPDQLQCGSSFLFKKIDAHSLPMDMKKKNRQQDSSNYVYSNVQHPSSYGDDSFHQALERAVQKSDSVYNDEENSNEQLKLQQGRSGQERIIKNSGSQPISCKHSGADSGKKHKDVFVDGQNEGKLEQGLELSSQGLGGSSGQRGGLKEEICYKLQNIVEQKQTRMDNVIGGKRDENSPQAIEMETLRSSDKRNIFREAHESKPRSVNTFEGEQSSGCDYRQVYYSQSAGSGGKMHNSMHHNEKNNSGGALLNNSELNNILISRQEDKLVYSGPNCFRANQNDWSISGHNNKKVPQRLDGKTQQSDIHLNAQNAESVLRDMSNLAERRSTNPQNEEFAAPAEGPKPSSLYSSRWISIVAACIAAQDSQQSPSCLFPYPLSSVLAPVSRLANSSAFSPLLGKTYSPTLAEELLSSSAIPVSGFVAGDKRACSNASSAGGAKIRRGPGQRKREKTPAHFLETRFSARAGPATADQQPVSASYGRPAVQVAYCRDARNDALFLYSAKPKRGGADAQNATGRKYAAASTTTTSRADRGRGGDAPSVINEFSSAAAAAAEAACSHHGARGKDGCSEANLKADLEGQSPLQGEGQGEAGAGGGGESRNRCGVCSRVFTRSWLLKGHMRTHTGERPFRCTWPQCQRAFADKSNLRSHTLIHTTTAKSFSCPKCARAFSQKRYLHKHMLEVCRII